MSDIRLYNSALIATSSIAKTGFVLNHDIKLFTKPINSLKDVSDFDNKVFSNAKFLKLLTANLDDLKLSRTPSFTSVPNLVNAELYPHQRNGIHFIVSRPGHCILASDMGCGKSLMILCAMSIMSCRNSLIICPAALITNWQREITRFMPSFEVRIIKSKKDGTIKLQNQFEETKSMVIYVMSYKIACSSIGLLSARKWDFLACDEAHALKHHKSQRSKDILKLSKVVKKCVLMSGTVAMKVIDLWHLLKIVSPDIFTEFYTHEAPRGMKCLAHCNEKHFYYADRYCMPECKPIGQGKLIYTFNRPQRLHELHALTYAFILRQKLEDCVSLPPFLREYVAVCKSSPTQKKKFDKEMLRLDELRLTNKFDADVAFMALIRETSVHKQKPVLDYILLQCEASKEKMVIFVQHHQMAEFLHQGLDKVKHIVINGETPKSQRDSMLQSFEHTDVQIGILSLGVCSTGLNLTFCRRVFCAELTFDSVQHHQSEYRCYRIGQKNKVVFQYLGMEDSTDDILWKSLGNKIHTSASILEN